MSDRSAGPPIVFERGLFWYTEFFDPAADLCCAPDCREAIDEDDVPLMLVLEPGAARGVADPAARRVRRAARAVSERSALVSALPMRALIPGVYVDRRATLHLDIPRLMVLRGFMDLRGLPDGALRRWFACVALSGLRAEIPHGLIVARMKGVKEHVA